MNGMTAHPYSGEWYLYHNDAHIYPNFHKSLNCSNVENVTKSFFYRVKDPHITFSTKYELQTHGKEKTSMRAQFQSSTLLKNDKVLSNIFIAWST